MFTIYCIAKAIEGLVKLLILVFSIPVRIFLAVSNACDRHNRRRARLRAFREAQLARDRWYAKRVPQSQQWPPRVPVRGRPGAR